MHRHHSYLTLTQVRSSVSVAELSSVYACGIMVLRTVLDDCIVPLAQGSLCNVDFAHLEAAVTSV